MERLVGASVADVPSTRPKARKSRVLPALVAIALALGAFGLWHWLKSGDADRKQPEPAAPQVGAAKVVTGDIDQIISGLGTVTPLATITVQAQIAGQLMSVGYKEGQIVNKGDFLAQIDDRPYVALKQQYEGQLAHDQGVLDQARVDDARYALLLKQNSIARQTAEDQTYIVKQNEGQVATDKALIAQQNLNIFYCHIVAPVTGRVGLRLVDAGNYVTLPNTNGLVVLTQLQPISIIFVVPEDNIQEIWEEERAGKALPVAATNRTDDKVLANGVVDSLDNLVDTTTGTVKIRANFPNDDFKLFPNQFVNARLLLRALKGVAVAPVSAVQHGAPGAYVYRIKPDDTVEVRTVKTGVTEGDRVQILSGVDSGDQVVVDGADRLRDGMKIRIVADPGNAVAGPAENPPKGGSKSSSQGASDGGGR